ncbi:MAG: hypothetical protein JSS30_07480 [Verrucomicrobia bacterium]|nr:hypothetical protein [Verrucomicrobiota bacterium]
MVIRGVTPGRGAAERGPEPKKKISSELKTNIADTKSVAARAVFTRGRAKIEGYTKGSANPSEDRKAGKVARRTMYTQKI